MNTPTFQHERALVAQGYCQIVGVDEAGAGALAGPVVAAAVVLPLGVEIELVRDSKMLSERQRERAYEKIVQTAVAWSVGGASAREIDAMNIRQATYLAMRRAVGQVEEVDFALVDAWTVPGLTVEQLGIIKGDREVTSIAAASIIAKVTRDRMMRAYHDQYPLYGFDGHKGYGTKGHRESISRIGPCAIHRQSYTLC
ncbi:ribonuclease HII [Candidatus Uhrbacteria bacterium]|nr:ribonuclease HII [Candidatus Uhrbacteria bacterium]